jgi:uncharacterized glyoxalase superfamily protein PhnB
MSGDPAGDPPRAGRTVRTPGRWFGHDERPRLVRSRLQDAGRTAAVGTGQFSRSPAAPATSTVEDMNLDSVTLEVADTTAAARFHSTAFGLDASRVRLRACEAPTTGFRGFTLSLVVSQPGNVDALAGAALEAGATTLKPTAKSLWGYGGVVQAPDGTIWKIATSAKKDTAPVSRDFDELVLLLGVEDVKATRRFYVEQGLTVGKSFGGKYVEFAAGQGDVKLALYKRTALAKDAGVAAEGTGSHRLVLAGANGPFTDPDGFTWEASAALTRTD